MENRTEENKLLCKGIKKPIERIRLVNRQNPNHMEHCTSFNTEYSQTLEEGICLEEGVSHYCY